MSENNTDFICPDAIARKVEHCLQGRMCVHRTIARYDIDKIPHMMDFIRDVCINYRHVTHDHSGRNARQDCQRQNSDECRALYAEKYASR